jgi:hypothetical protein
MKENEHKNIEQFVDKVMKETPLESPSPDFTPRVMANVLEVNKRNATVYKPLISKRGWLSIIAAIAYFIINGTQSAVQPGSFDLSGKSFFKSFTDSHLFQFSTITAEVIIFSTILIFIQITLLKSHLNKRFEK